MPINFEQPDPMGYSPLAGVPGQVAQGNLDRQYLMQMTQQGIEAGKAARPDYGSAAATANANAQRSTQANIAGMQQNVSPAQQYQENAQQSMQNQQQASQQAMQAQQFSYQDSVRLSQLQNAMASVDNNPDLSEEEKANYKMQLQTGIDPLTQKQQAAKTAMMQQQTQEWQQQEAMKAAGIKTFHQFATDNPSGVKDLGNGTLMAYKPDGTPIFHKVEQQQPDQGLPLKDQMAIMKEWRNSRMDVVKQLSTKDELGNTQHPEDADVDSMMKKLGHGRTLDEELSKYGARGQQSQQQAPATPVTKATPQQNFITSLNGPALHAAVQSGNEEPMRAAERLQPLMSLPADKLRALPPEAKAQMQKDMQTLAPYKVEGGSTAAPPTPPSPSPAFDYEAYRQRLLKQRGQEDTRPGAEAGSKAGKWLRSLFEGANFQIGLPSS